MIEYVDDAAQPVPSDLTVVAYVGGPRAGRQEVISGRVPPSAILLPDDGGLYERSVRCADDGALRYVWTTR